MNYKIRIVKKKTIFKNSFKQNLVANFPETRYRKKKVSADEEK